MGVQFRFGLRDPVQELNITGDILSKMSEHVEGVLVSSSFLLKSSDSPSG